VHQEKKRLVEGSWPKTGGSKKVAYKARESPRGGQSSHCARQARKSVFPIRRRGRRTGRRRERAEVETAKKHRVPGIRDELVAETIIKRGGGGEK